MWNVQKCRPTQVCGTYRSVDLHRYVERGEYRTYTGMWNVGSVDLHRYVERGECRTYTGMWNVQKCRPTQICGT